MYDPYYETKVNTRISSFSRLGPIMFILFGLEMIALTIVDLTLGMTSITNSSWQENSIWPTIGKGIWVGALVRHFLIPIYSHTFIDNLTVLKLKGNCNRYYWVNFHI